MILEWMTDPTAWAGFAALILLELVLGIDNLVFIAILVEKLQPKYRDRARRMGLLMALGMRVLLLAGISTLAKLTDPLFSIAEHAFSERDLILMTGGLFLLWKATAEIHGRLEGKGGRKPKEGFKAHFWMVIAQIVVLDAVFSLNSVITAIGMTHYLSMMIAAVVVAIMIMMWTSKMLTDFISSRPTLVMLCLGFLMMVGFSLLAEGLGAEIPKGYLYAAIGFSLLIEMVNQFAQTKLKKRIRTDINVRHKTSDAILKLLGAKKSDGGEEEAQEAGAVLQEAAKNSVLSSVEKEMLRGVLNLSERPVNSIMTPRMDVEFLDIRKGIEDIFSQVKNFGRSHILVVDGEIDNVLGILRRDDFLVSCLDTSQHALSPKILHEPMFVQKRTQVMALLEIFKKKPIEMAVVIDEFGSVEGVVTHLDLLEAIAGEFPDRDEPEALNIAELPDGTGWLIEGLTSIYDVRNKLGVDYEPDGRFATIAGLVLHEMGRFPAQGDTMEWRGFKLTVETMDGRRIDKIRAEKLPEPPAG